MPRVHAPGDGGADGRALRGRRVMVGQDVVPQGASESADVDEYQPPSLDDCGGGTEDYRSGRKSLPPPSGTPPCSPRGKPAHPPQLHPYHAPLSPDPRPPPLSTSCSAPDDWSGSIAKIASRCSPTLLPPAPLVPTRCCFACNRILGTPPPVTTIQTSRLTAHPLPSSYLLA